jgi:23S rRNA pseudouridine1911/1915/1917 synthase
VQRIQVKVTEKDCGKRLDVLLAEKIPTLTRTHIQKIIRNKYVWVNDVPQKVSYRVSPEDLICLEIIDPVPLQTVPEAIPLEIIFEDSWIIVVNKPAGMVVHPSWGHYSGTLVHALLYHCPTLAGIGGTIRPGIVHRLDKGTSGILVVAKNDQAHQALSHQFKNHTIVRRYQALVYGSMQKESGTITSLIGRHPVHRKKMSTKPRKGREAVTHWRIKDNFANLSFLEVILETGRTHQVRVHLSSVGHPIVGDSVYGSSKRLRELDNLTIREFMKGTRRPLLHAGYLRFLHPATMASMDFEVPLPNDFAAVLNTLRNEQ